MEYGYRKRISKREVFLNAMDAHSTLPLALARSIGLEMSIIISSEQINSILLLFIQAYPLILIQPPIYIA